MDDTPNLALPYLAPAQAQKHVTHNEALRMLDAVVQLSVVDRDLMTPPASPTEGERHIVAAGATGAWAGRDGQVAMWRDGAWGFSQPRPGWLAWVAAESVVLVHGATSWGRLDHAAPLRLVSATVAALPSPAPAGAMIYVIDESGGAVPAFSDGTAWRRVTDRAVVS
jgi:hypothetical protein